MQAQAYEGYVEDGQFYPKGTLVRLPGRRRAMLTILSEQVQDEENQTAWLDDFRQMVTDTTEEKLRIEDFPRFDLGREPIIFSDAE